MKNTKKIHNLDTLEREIYRLQAEVNSIEKKFDHNISHLEENYSSMIANSIFHRKKSSDTSKESFFETMLSSEKMSAFINRLTDRISSNTTERLEKLIEKLFHKRKD